MDCKNKTSITRRSALLGGSATVAAVTAWQTPILKSVILPAHAQMSAQVNFFGGATATDIVNNKSLIDVIIPQAYAGMPSAPSKTEFTIQIAPQESGDYRVDVFSDTSVEGGVFTSIQVLHGGIVPLGQITELAVEQNPCEEKLRSFEVNVLRDNGDSIDIDLVDAGIEVNVPAGEGMLPSPECGYAIANTYFSSEVEGVTIGVEGASNSSVSPFELLVEPAYAQREAPTHGFSITRDGTGTNVIVTQLSSRETILRRGTLDSGGSSGVLQVIETSCGNNELGAYVSSVSLDEISIVLQLRSFGPTEFTVPAASLGTLAVNQNAECE